MSDEAVVTPADLGAVYREAYGERFGEVFGVQAAREAAHTAGLAAVARAVRNGLPLAELPVVFDLADDDTYFVLTTALADVAARWNDSEEGDTKRTWAAVADTLRARIEQKIEARR